MTCFSTFLTNTIKTDRDKGRSGKKLRKLQSVDDVERLVIQHLMKARVVTDVRIRLHLLGTNIAHRHNLVILRTVPRGDVTQGDTADAMQADF